MRSIWKGHIRFLLVAIPVRVYNAIETSEQIHLNQLHKDDYGPIGYDKRCKKCNKVVSKDDIIKGYQYSKDQYAILEPDDLAAIAPQEEGLVIYKLRYPKEVRKISEVPDLETHEIDKNELKLAHTLVDQMVTSIDQIEMRDRYSEALKEIIEAKIEGKEVAGFVEEEQPTVDIMTALKESIKQAQRKPMVKATGKTKKQEEAEEAKPKKARKSKAS